MITIKELRKLFKQAKKEGVPSNAIILIDVNKTDKQINTLENDYVYSVDNNNQYSITLFFDKSN